ncbi:hypothetical protein PIB30_010966 [Stylosanthes scabra]|uniref:Uncharacterized protein n=1 Tax=Stylosanthes scabra TaxID=79078 RepID=A0ABU6U4G6_9FABA|nr:hypothetical protein [Stylosanthes scabra]
MDPHAFNTLYSMVGEQSFDSSRSFNRREIGEDGVHRPGSVPHVDLNFNVSWSQEGDEAARYTRFKDTDQCNSNDNDMDEDEDGDEKEDYLVTDEVGDDNEASRSAAGPSTPTEAGTRYDLRTENFRRSPNRFTPSGWSTKNLKKGVSRIYKNAKDRLKKN